MYRKIAVPVDLFHAGQITGAPDVAADLARHYGASLHYIGVTAETPTAVAHNPKDLRRGSKRSPRIRQASMASRS